MPDLLDAHGRMTWRDMAKAIMRGVQATAYFAPGNPLEVECVHVGRRELEGRSAKSILHDPMFDIGRPNNDWTAPVTISSIGRMFMDGATTDQIAERHNLMEYDRSVINKRRRSAIADVRARDREARRRWREANRMQVLSRTRQRRKEAARTNDRTE